MRKFLQFAVLVSAGTGMLAAQWYNLPVERANFRATPLTVADMERIVNAEKQIKQRQSDERAARAVFIPYGAGCERFSGIVSSTARKHNLSPRLMAAQIVVESGCKSAVVSPAGAVGLMQVECRHTWRQYSRQELMNPARNADVGADILSGYIRQTGSYREGLKRYFGVTPGSDQADAYADKVLAIAGRRK
jgi:soluble lytic murein transglycosylase-like protein